MRLKTPVLFEPIAESELVLNADGSVYHLHLKPQDIADTIFLVGDPGRVAQVSSRFQSIEVRVANREFVTHTGMLNGKRITVMSTGIGTDNIDIVVNELDALVNIDLLTRIPKEQHHTLNLIRIGTSGSLQEDLPVDTFIFSAYGLGLDGVLGFYEHAEEEDEREIRHAFTAHTNWPSTANPPYVAKADQALLNTLSANHRKGITLTANGFYGPQGRALRIKPAHPEMNERVRSFAMHGLSITNYEMETSALYALGGILGHKTCTACAVIANRYIKAYSKDYKIAVNNLIDELLAKV